MSALLSRRGATVIAADVQESLGAGTANSSDDPQRQQPSACSVLLTTSDSGNSCSGNNNSNNNNTFNIQKQPAFYLAITRRELLPLLELRALALTMGLQVNKNKQLQCLEVYLPISISIPYNNCFFIFFICVHGTFILI